MFSLNRKSPFHFQVNPVVIFVVVGCLLLNVSTTLVMAHSGGEVMSKKTPSPITIDGNLDEWAAVFAESSPLQDIAVDPRAHGQDWYQIIAGGGADSDTNNGGLRVSRGQFDGDDDFLARWATLWDDNYLYFAFDVTDDSVHPYANDVATRTRQWTCRWYTDWFRLYRRNPTTVVGF